MALFQNPASTPEELELSKPLETPPEEVNKVDEDEWYAKVYRGERAPQLTFRATAMGIILGFLLAFTNVYIGLKAGWHLGVALTACILSFAIWNLFLKLGLARSPMSILENNCMQSTASAAGYSTGGTMISAIPALLMLSVTPDNPKGTQLAWPVALLWTFFLGALGTCLAIPMKRNLINQERLRFPSGIAAATTLQGLYSHGESALVKARALFYAALASGFLPVLKDLNAFKVGTDAAGKAIRGGLLPGALNIFNIFPALTIAGKKIPLSDFNMKLDYSPAFLAAGALIGLRVTASMMVGALALALWIAPHGMESAWLNPATGKEVMAVTRAASSHSQIGLWLGAPMLVAAGLLSFAFQWRSIARAFSGLRKGAANDKDAAAQAIRAQTEVPTSWFIAGGLFAATGVIVIVWRYFDVPVYYGALAVVLTFVLALVACRTTGESDVTPTGAMGKIMQLIYGGLIPQNATANLMSAGITAGAASASADLLTDLKSGYLLGANPRRQFVAQFAGIVPGAIATIIGYYVLVPDATALTGKAGADPTFPAPAAQQWKAVAQVFRDGIGNLHPMARQCIYIGIIAGVALVLVERLFTIEPLKKYKPYTPSAMGVGLGLIVPFYQPLAFFIGAIIGEIAQLDKKSKAASLVIPIASGMIAGESLIGVIVTALNNFVLV